MTCWYSLCFSFGFLYLLVAGKPEDRNFRFFIDDFIIKPVARDLFDHFNCKVSHTRNRSFLSCSMIVSRNIYEIELDSSLDMIQPNKQTRRLYSVRFNACQFLVTFHKTRIFNVIAKSIAKSINGNLTCPIVSVNTKNFNEKLSLISIYFFQNFNYSLTNWYLEDNFFPRYVPECRFKVFTKFFSKNKCILSYTLLGRIIQSK
ncbi:hypothetical protein KR222_004928 [Zaprionus bogoriensis]|nr:hypothetical protein KR222_004928 [Zaprionus bogoriensis]